MPQNSKTKQNNEEITSVDSRLSSIEESLNGISKTLNTKLEDINGKILSLDKDLKQLTKSQTFISSQFDNFKVITDTIMKENSKLTKENQDLREKQAQLELEIQKVNDAIDEQEQYGRRSMLEISGIPRTSYEDDNQEETENILLRLSSKLEVKIEREDIDAIHRLSRKPNANIIVKFHSRKIRNALYAARAKLKNVTTHNLGIATERATSKIFINESLTKKRKELLYNVRIFKRNMNYKYMWTRNGSICIRLDDHSPALYIRRKEDLPPTVE